MANEVERESGLMVLFSDEDLSETSGSRKAETTQRLDRKSVV